MKQSPYHKPPQNDELIPIFNTLLSIEDYLVSMTNARMAIYDAFGIDLTDSTVDYNHEPTEYRNFCDFLGCAKYVMGVALQDKLIAISKVLFTCDFENVIKGHIRCNSMEDLLQMLFVAFYKTDNKGEPNETPKE